MTQDDLQRLFAFTDADLAANRRGAESAQQRRMRLGARRRLVIIGLAVPVVGFMAALQFRSPGAQVFGVLLALVGISATLYLAVTRFRPTVSRVTGTAHVRHSTERSGHPFLLDVGTESFAVAYEVYEQFTADTACTVYFQQRPTSRVLLSIEPAAP